MPEMKWDGKQWFTDAEICRSAFDQKHAWAYPVPQVGKAVIVLKCMACGAEKPRVEVPISG